LNIKRTKMADRKTNAQATYKLPARNPALKNLDKLVGLWNVTGRDGSGGELKGTEKYEWMEGGFFLKQEIDQDYAGQRINGIQIIGYEKKWGSEEPGDECTSHFFDNMGNSWEYVWEVEGNMLTIWGGYIGSPAAYRGSFSDDGNTLSGRWDWPGGGYESISVRANRQSR
jgi:hypothetical protein